MAKQVLVIEDDRVVREMLKEFLYDSYDVLLACYAKEGLRILSREVGLVFLDYKLPDASGLEVLRRIKESHPSTPVIFMTGYGSEELCRKAFRAGARDYINKPFEKHEVCSKVDLFMAMSASQEKRSNKFLELAHEKEGFAEDKDIPDDILKNILRVKEYLDENYSKQIDLSKALKLACMNKSL